MKAYCMVIILILCLLMVSKCDDPLKLQISERLVLKLKEGSISSYLVKIPKDLSSSQDLYIRAKPTIADPLQVPYLTVSSDNTKNQNCYNAHQSFAGICKINSKQLKKGKEFIIQIKVVVESVIELEAYLSDVIILPIGEDLQLNSYSATGLTVVALIKVPQDAQYSALAITAAINNIQRSAQSLQSKLQMLINVGLQDVEAPTDKEYQIAGYPLFTGGRGAYLSKDDAKPGNWIKVYLRLQIGISITFTVSQISDDTSVIALGKSYFDHTTQDLQKTYFLDLSKHLEEVDQKTIELVFDIYSGSPTIEIAFDSAFNDQIPFSKDSSATRYTISPDLRKDFNFTDSIYIRVNSTVASQYYFYTKVIRQDVTYIESYLTYFSEIDQNKVENFIMVQRFAYQQSKKNNIVNYTFNIDVISGHGNFYLRRCSSIEDKDASKQNLSSCLLTDPSDLQNPSFIITQIEAKQIVNAYKTIIHVSFDILKCSDLGNSSSASYKQCGFQIIAVGQSEKPFIFSITAQRRQYATYLKENVPINDYIYKKQYIYYVFSLPSIEGVVEIDIIMTTISGESALIVSSSEQNPTLQSKSPNTQIKSGQANSIILSGNKLAQQIYIAVYGYEFTEISLTVVVHRSPNNSSSNDTTGPPSIQLQNGVLIFYTLNKSSQTASFKLNSGNAPQVAINVNQLVGYTIFQVFDSSNSPQTCTGKKDNPSVCEFKAVRNTEYRVQVYGQIGQINKFSIIFRSNSLECTSSALNIPIKVTLHSSEQQCFEFPINRDVDIRFVSSFTHVQLINQQIQTNIYFQQTKVSTLSGTHYIFRASDMAKTCQLSSIHPGFVKTCLLSIKFTSKSNTTQIFSIITQEIDAQIVLFDGIVQKVDDLKIAQGGGKLFYYFLYNKLPIKIFFTTSSLTYNYLLMAKMIDQKQFLARKKLGGVSLWTDFIDQQNAGIVQPNSSLYIANLSDARTSSVVISQQYVDKYCNIYKGCYLLLTIAVMGNQNLDQYSDIQLQQVTYQIEASQQQIYLSLGQTKIGFIQPKSIFTYLVDPEDAIVQISNLNRDSAINAKCASLFVLDSNGTQKFSSQLRGSLQLQKKDQVNRIFVYGGDTQCSYQISYTSIKQPVKTVRLSTPYELSLQLNQTQAFLYYNSHPDSFRIVALLSAGTTEIYILPFNQVNLTLKAVTQLDYHRFPMVDQWNGDYIVSSMNSQFCSECFYYVVVASSKGKFIGEIVFLRMLDPVPMTVRHILMEQLVPETQVGTQSYIFYSLNSFNIRFVLGYGQLQVSIIDPELKELVNETINQTKIFNIKAVQYTTKQLTEFYSSKAKYIVKVTALKQTMILVQFDHQKLATQRIFEGFPNTIHFTKNIPKTIEFVNSQDYDKPLTLMADVFQVYETDTYFSLALGAQLEDGSFLNHSSLYRSFVKSENTYICSFNNVKGIYYISAKTTEDADLTFLLFKNSLTHLTPSNNHFFDKEGIFQLTSNNQNVLIQIFNCKGDLEVIASKSYQDIVQPQTANDSLINIKRANYGGHYIFKVQNVTGSYFLKVINKNQSKDLQYLINYYHYNDVNPYDNIDSNNLDVVSAVTENGLIVNVSAPYLSYSSNSSLVIKNTKYWVYASNSIENLYRSSRCSIEDNVVKSYSNDSSKISLNNTSLDSLNSQGTLYVNVQASIEIQVSNQSASQGTNYPKVLTILYNTIQVQHRSRGFLQYKYWFTDNLFIFIGWMLLPFFLAAIALYYVIKICFRIMLMRQKNMVETNEVVNSISTDAHLNGEVVVNQMDTADMNIKGIEI